ncbi:neutral/alkaline non-lysosomal ceramidase N-terminal domain-containing protein [Aquirufa rosea]|uniref:Neutral ceramidase n=1 Tax=Aquirufa rosea TaxID=2509241 RepID=A0A4Q1C021_9BACT|nr:neutral/alkaline non-lysosomal ceramidase N-terminal domain-containing protein [Aquirufa rosea]RXK49750.1 hypothetical protein ESB04_06130 [Aquirufa rosea]
MIIRHLLLIFWATIGTCFSQSSFQVGIAKINITPKSPAFLTGYANRDKPAEGVVHDLWAKAIVVTNKKEKVIIVTTDLLGLSHQVSTEVAQKIQEKLGIERRQLMFNSSHTHSGPMIWPSLSVIANYSYEEQKIVSEYTQVLIDKLVEVISHAYAQQVPMQVAIGKTSANFAINRRALAARKNGILLADPIDHEVPVLTCKNASGEIKAVLFGYACHNTTVTGNNYLINGDYAGFAQIDIEKQIPNATAFFILGCAGDQNPEPRGTVELAQQHGNTLAKQVIHLAFSGEMKSISNDIQSDFTTINLRFKKVRAADYQKDLQSTDKFIQRRAKLMLEAYNKGWNTDHYNYPVQGIRLGREFRIIALGGEVVVDYSLRTKEDFPNKNIFVAGYSNEVMCYIPSERVLKEGGYEAESSMIYYGMPGPFETGIEEKIMKAIHQIVKNIN